MAIQTQATTVTYNDQITHPTQWMVQLLLIPGVVSLTNYPAEPTDAGTTPEWPQLPRE
jgi:hypothetical protein